MTDLGSITSTPAVHLNPDLIVLTGVVIHRGIHLGAVASIVPARLTVALHSTSDYIVRQIRVLYRQLWPSHGQRFPQ